MRAPCSQAGALHSQPPTPGHRAAVGDAKTMRRSQWKRQPFQMAQAATTALSSALSLVSVAGGQGRPRPEKPVSLIHQSRVTISRRDQYLTAPELWAMGYRRCAGTGAEASHQSREPACTANANELLRGGSHGIASCARTVSAVTGPFGAVDWRGWGPCRGGRFRQGSVQNAITLPTGYVIDPPPRPPDGAAAGKREMFTPRGTDR
jgi:hypothetical protein